MWVVSFLAFFFIALQAIICKCDLLGMLAALCLLSSFVMVGAPDMRWWLRVLVSAIPVALLCILVYWAGWLDMLYLGRISEYRYAAIEASAIIILHFLALLPEGKLKQNQSASAVPSVVTE